MSEAELVRRLQAGDEEAFAEVVGRYHQMLVVLARPYVASDAVAQEVVQEAWLGALRALDRFEGRSSLKTWLAAIVINRAKTTGIRERRHLAVGGAEDVVDPKRFDSSGGWVDPPHSFEDDVDQRLEATGQQEIIAAALESLPPAQRMVVTLRDVEGLTSNEVCALLEISMANQRVLLHRGRAKIRQSLEDAHDHGVVS